MMRAWMWRAQAVAPTFGVWLSKGEALKHKPGPDYYRLVQVAVREQPTSRTIRSKKVKSQHAAREGFHGQCTPGANHSS